jgi:hypothetical protein
MAHSLQGFCLLPDVRGKINGARKMEKDEAFVTVS